MSRVAAALVSVSPRFAAGKLKRCVSHPDNEHKIVAGTSSGERGLGMLNFGSSSEDLWQQTHEQFGHRMPSVHSRHS